MSTEGEKITEEAFADFEAWLRNQTDEVQEMSALEQVERYYSEAAAEARWTRRAITIRLRMRPSDAIHHIDGNPLNNELSNLRVVKFSENARRKG